MFNLFKNNNDLFSPVDGRAIKLTDVSDEAFSSLMLGDGMAFELSGDVICAPCAGELIFIASSKHAFGIRMANGLEVMVHIGLDTVNYNGTGFIQLAKYKQVKVGDPIIKVDREFFKKENVNLTTMLVLTNYKEYKYELLNVDLVIKGKNKIIRIK